MEAQDIEAARLGDEDAIAALIQKAMLTKAVQVEAAWHKQEQATLQVVLQSARLPDRSLCRLVYAVLLGLGAPTIQTVCVVGRQTGQKAAVWTQRFILEIRPSKADQTKASQTHLASVPIQVLPVSHAAVSSAVPVVHRSRGLLLPAILVSFVTGAGFSYLSQQLSAAPQSAQIAMTSVAANRLEPSRPPSTALPPPTPAQPIAPTGAPIISIKAVGDIVPGTNFPGDRLPPDGGQYLFDNVKPFLSGADILFGNFESTLTDYPYSAKDISRGMTFAFRTPPAFANVLKDAGFDVLSVANNHSFDFSDQGFLDTIANIEQVGIQAIGQKGKISYLKAKGLTIAFIGFSYLPDHNWMLDLDRARALVDEAKKYAKIVVISVHAGAEGTDAVRTFNQTEGFFGEDRGNSVLFAHTLIDQGASLVLGHGPHVPRSLELYKGKLIAYSLGNFVGYRTLSSEGILGNSLILQADLTAEGKFVSGKVIPVLLDDQGVPYIDNSFSSVSLIRNLIETDFPVTPILIDDAGQISLNEAK